MILNFRAFAYFCIRYFLKLGFLDGRAGWRSVSQARLSPRFARPSKLVFRRLRRFSALAYARRVRAGPCGRFAARPSASGDTRPPVRVLSGRPRPSAALPPRDLDFLRGGFAALKAGHKFLELGAEALGLRRLTMPDRIRQKPFQLLDAAV